MSFPCDYTNHLLRYIILPLLAGSVSQELQLPIRRCAMIPLRHKEQTYSLAVEQYEDGYRGYFPALPGCYGWGATYDAAVKNADDALTLYLQILPENDP